MGEIRTKTEELEVRLRQLGANPEEIEGAIDAYWKMSEPERQLLLGCCDRDLHHHLTSARLSPNYGQGWV